jgi:predicted transcriptional regulator
VTDALHDAIVSYITANPGKRASDISNFIGGNAATIRTRLANMVAREQINREGVNQSAKYYPSRVTRPKWETPDEYIQASSIWRVGQRCAAEAKGREWRAEHA